MNRPEFYRFHQRANAPCHSPRAEYDARLAGPARYTGRKRVDDRRVLTSMHNIAYYSGFLYCSFGRPYGLVVTATDSVTISAGIDAGQPWRRCHGDKHHLYRLGARQLLAGRGAGRGHWWPYRHARRDHLTLTQRDKLTAFLSPARGHGHRAGHTMRSG